MRAVVLIAAFIIFSSSAAAFDINGFLPWEKAKLQVSECTSLLDPYKVVSSKNYEVIRGTNSFEYHDYDLGFEFSARVTAGNRILSFNSRLRDDNEKIRSLYSGRSLFDFSIAHFGLENISGIAGNWVYGDNLKAYYKNLDAGMTPEDAARNTWTGQQAARHGFTDVYLLPNFVYETEIGRPGVSAVFLKENSPLREVYK